MAATLATAPAATARASCLTAARSRLGAGHTAAPVCAPGLLPPRPAGRPAGTGSATTRSAAASTAGRCATISTSRPSPGQRADRGEHLRLRGGVEPGGRLVEQQHRPLGQQGAGNRDPPPLPGGKAAAPLPDGPAELHLMQRGAPRRPLHGRARRTWPAEPDVRFHRSVLQHRVLRHPATRARHARRSSWSRRRSPAASSITTLPASCVMKPSRTPIRVDFPLPLGPGAPRLRRRRTRSPRRPGRAGSCPGGTPARPRPAPVHRGGERGRGCA